MNKLDHEEFENYLEGDSDLSRAYAKLSKEEPSSDLDNLILEHARQEIKNESNNNPDNVTKIKKSLFSRRLDSPLAMAAVIVLCVSLILLVPQDEILLDTTDETTDEIIQESQPVMTDESDQDIDRQGGTVISKTRPAAAIETPKPEVVERAREESLSVKKELQQEARMEESQISEESSKSAPASAPVYQNETKARQQDQLKDDAEISSDVAPQGMLKMETEVAKRQLRNDSIVADKTSPEALSKEVKQLIKKGKIEKARSVYQQFIELFPEQPLTEWFTEQEMSLLVNR